VGGDFWLKIVGSVFSVRRNCFWCCGTGDVFPLKVVVVSFLLCFATISIYKNVVSLKIENYRKHRNIVTTIDFATKMRRGGIGNVFDAKV